MFPYRVKYNESESDIQNNDLLYKIHQKHQNTSKLLEQFETIQKLKVLFGILYKLHNLYFVIFGKYVIM